MSQRQQKKKRRAVGLPDRSVAEKRTNAALWICLALGVLNLLVFASVHNFGFISLDDPQYVVNNTRVTQGLTLSGVRWALAANYAGNWHPLTWISHMLDVDLFGLNAGAHHLTNALIHLLNSVLLFIVLYRMSGGLSRSAFVAALFAVHPLHVESVAWVAERKDVLSTLFWILSLGAYIAYVRNPRFTRMLAVIVLFALGLMSKPMVVTLPFVLLLLDYWPLARVAPDTAKRISAWLPLVREKLPLFALVIGSSLLTLAAQGKSGAVIAVEALPLRVRVANAIVSYVVYIRDMIWPARLAVFYPFSEPSPTFVILAVAVLAAVTFIAIKFARRAPYLLVGWAWYLGTLMPVIGIVQAGAQGRADRYTYVPLIGLFIIVAWGARDLAHRLRIGRMPLRLSAAAVVVAFAIAARAQVKYWANDLELWGHTVQVTRANYRAEDHYGVALSNAGRIDEAVTHWEKALVIWPKYAEARNNLGTARVDQGRLEDALHEFSEAARLKPYNANFHYNMAAVLSAKGDTAAAIREIRAAVRLDPSSAQFRNALEILGGQ
jgi:protein O-mannosyl-transferase